MTDELSNVHVTQIVNEHAVTWTRIDADDMDTWLETSARPTGFVYEREHLLKIVRTWRAGDSFGALKLV